MRVEQSALGTRPHTVRLTLVWNVMNGRGATICLAIKLGATANGANTFVQWVDKGTLPTSPTVAHTILLDSPVRLTGMAAINK